MGTELAVQLLIATITHAQELGQLISTAQAENRDLSAAELDGWRAKYDTAKAALLAEIAKQRASG
jgi:hypothetical protein